ncbi:hypothetical protein JW935_25215, partial [candidate division KSB1 bacterium]|nr:hypothetical protein [candidate division KSB1 bacterium]
MDYLLNRREIRNLSTRFSRTFIKEELNRILDQFRLNPPSFSTREECVALVLEAINQNLPTEPGLKRVINATGIVLHTGMGRAPLSSAAQQQLVSIIGGYCNIEIDLDTGK